MNRFASNQRRDLKRCVRARIRLARPAVLAAALVIATAACGSGTSAPRQPLIVYESRDAQNATNIWTIDADTRVTRQLTFGTHFDGNPGWTPDHKRIIFSSDRDSDSGKNDLYTMSGSGDDVRRLTSTPDASEWSAKFSPDSTHIVYVVDAPDGWYLSLMSADGSDPQRVAGPYKFAEFPSWRRDGVEVYFSAIAEDRSDADIYSYDTATRSSDEDLYPGGGRVSALHPRRQDADLRDWRTWRREEHRSLCSRPLLRRHHRRA